SASSASPPGAGDRVVPAGPTPPPPRCGTWQDRRMDLGLADRVYILTGASRGLGFATAEALVADGAKGMIASRDLDRVNEAVAALGPNAAGLAADLADPTAAQDLVDAARDHFGRFDGALIS